MLRRRGRAEVKGRQLTRQKDCLSVLDGVERSSNVRTEKCLSGLAVCKNDLSTLVMNNFS